MTETERQTLQDARAACLASAEAIAALLGEPISIVAAGSSRDPFMKLISYAAALGITEDAARKRVFRMAREYPRLVMKRGGRWWVHRDGLRGQD